MTDQPFVEHSIIHYTAHADVSKDESARSYVLRYLSTNGCSCNELVEAAACGIFAVNYGKLKVHNNNGASVAHHFCIVHLPAIIFKYTRDCAQLLDASADCLPKFRYRINCDRYTNGT